MDMFSVVAIKTKQMSPFLETSMELGLFLVLWLDYF